MGHLETDPKGILQKKRRKIRRGVREFFGLGPSRKAIAPSRERIAPDEMDAILRTKGNEVKLGQKG